MPIRKLYYFLGLLLLLGLFTVDLLTFLFPFWGTVGVILWYISFLFIIPYVLSRLKELITVSIQAKTPLTLITLSILISLTLIYSSTPNGLSGETTQEINCVLRQLTQNPDRGFHQTCLFGYPSRQYFLPALPSLLFGRSLTALNFGGGIYFLIGVTLFASNLYLSIKQKRQADIITSLCLGSLLHFYYFNHFLFYYEQSIFPLSLGLLLVGTYIHFEHHPHEHLLIPLSLSLVYLIFAYTPGLSLALLGIVALAYHLLTHKSHRIPLIIIGAILIAMLGFSFAFRKDVTIFERTTPLPLSDLVQGVEHLLFFNHGQAWATPFMTSLFIITILLGLGGVLKKQGIFFSLWIIGVVAFALISKGYFYYPIPFRLHRALVTIPIFLLMVSTLLRNKQFFKRESLISFIIFFIIQSTGLLYHLVFIQSHPPHPHYGFIQWFKKQVSNTSFHTLVVTKKAGDVDDLRSLKDTLQYFQPDITTTYSTDENIFSLKDCLAAYPNTQLLLIPQDNPCHSKPPQPSVINEIGTFTAKNGQALTLVEIIQPATQ